MRLDLSHLLKSRGSSLLGLTLEGRRLEGVVLRRKNGGMEVGHFFEAALSLDPLTNDPTLVDRRSATDWKKPAFRENRCAVGVPLNWAMTTQVPLPEMPEEDVASFLAIQAEKGFPYEPDDLLMATLRCRTPKGSQYATLVAIPKNHLVRLDAVLAGARLKPVSFSLLVTALQPPQNEGSQGILSLVAGESNVDLQVTCGGGVIVLRSLLDAVEMDGSRAAGGYRTTRPGTAADPGPGSTGVQRRNHKNPGVRAIRLETSAGRRGGADCETPGPAGGGAVGASGR